WQSILEKTGIINTVLTSFGLQPLRMINTNGAIILGMVYNFLPFMILPIYNALEDIDGNVINAARDLGANSRQTFFRVIFPLSMPGVISGITMVFIPALTTFVVSSLLGGGKILLIGNVIEQEFMVAYDWNLGSGLSLVLLIFIIINVIVSAVTEKE
ncbi:MAG: ABC transporter permease, partial [Lachnospiraceae bacterium]|nr:ABC transporter permease [Lachnospiraceae bacterium]